MLTFIHLSDIHFLNRDHGTQFDVEQHIRRALIEDLSSNPAGNHPYDALLITGDIAFKGHQDEYTIAKQFLEEVFQQTSVSPVETYVVPGNHDVDRNFVAPKFPLWDSHERIRASASSIEWRDILDTQLHKDPLQSLLAPLRNYNSFAQGFDCASQATQLAWHRVFPKKLEDGTAIHLHGLNSALVSNAADAPAKLLVSEFQTAHLRREDAAINVVLCHHPPEWLMDKKHLKEILKAFTSIALFGHEHTTGFNAESTLLQLYAGAVQPSLRDPGDWVPTYHILQLSLPQSPGRRELRVTVHTREFSTARGYRFLPRVSQSGNLLEEFVIRLPPIPIMAEGTHLPTPELTTMRSDDPTASEQRDQDVRRLLVSFFRLGTPLRYAVAIQLGLIREGDESLDPQQMWSEIFRRAIDEGRLQDFWDAVAKNSSALQGQSNPFRS